MIKHIPIITYEHLNELDLVVEHAKWSQETFGSDTDRGPIGPLKHLAKEVPEMLDAYDLAKIANGFLDSDSAYRNFHVEVADGLLLLIDAARRGGLKFGDLIRVAYDKLQVNKQREWPKPVDDEAVEHVRK